MNSSLLRYFFERLYSKLENSDTILEAEIPYYDAAVKMILSEYGEVQAEKSRDFIYSVFINIVCKNKPVQLEDICKIRIYLIELVPECARKNCVGCVLSSGDVLEIEGINKFRTHIKSGDGLR
jgi:hypothetical protein